MVRLMGILFSFICLSWVAEALPGDELYEKLQTAPTAQNAVLPAKDVLDALKDSGSGTVDLLMQRVGQAGANGRFDLAGALLDRVIQIAPNYTEGWFQRSGLFLRDKNYGEALRDLNEVLKLEPRHFPAWYRTGEILESLGSREEAQTAYQKALSIHPFLAPAEAGLARLSTRRESLSL